MADLTPDDPGSIGGYRLLSRLGAGGMGRVYLARSGGGRTVAVKLIKNELADDPSFRTRFRLEVEAARRVGDRWTAPVLDADTEAETPWVATGYIAGPSLEQVIAAGEQGGTLNSGRHGHGPLPGESLRTLAYGLASALLDIHGSGLIHRDLKPSNVLLTIDGPRVIDFGIARALDDVPESTLTSTGVVVGSPSYMSPEQITGRQLTTASDVFCLGAVLAYAATGRPPFGVGGAGGVHTVMFRIASEDPDLDGVEEPMRSLMADCLAKEPGDRPAPEDVIERVQPIAVGASAPPWLPAGLIAELGRHAVQLLDTDTPPSGSGVHTSPVPHSGSGAAPEPVTSLLPRTGPDPGTGPAPDTGMGPDSGSGSGGFAAGSGGTGRPRRRRTRALLVAAAVLAVVGAGVTAAATGLGPLGDGNKKKAPASDVPSAYVGTWTGAVERNGEPTGQYRRFVITTGMQGETVASSISLGDDYACKSDGKLAATPSSGPEGGTQAVRLDTRVVKSVPEGRCTALGQHSLIAQSGGTLKWEAQGRTATLHKVKSPERIPEELVGDWQRPLSGGGRQKLTIKPQDVDGKGMSMVSEGAEHCEATMDVFSAGGSTSPVRVAPPEVNKARSRGVCRAGTASTLRAENGSLIREFPDGRSLRYVPVT
ncbi:serine/threonine-protein kinase [Streptomyces iconiensis]|uniref:Serine/threonine-protein kinase n=1 Tax=Streptomyces iconiensis TaxID=1384038 RepID=A0ABT7A042_9ACTN|nr:serine/threonine-protein kinase [Streptomyces iconiensis]MDJ1134702.1 serine/threonine-protein kinase [Streptomyces iconiensis]